MNKINEIRESSNNFWVAVNGLGISAVAHFHVTQNIMPHHKPFVLWTIIIIGMSLCLSWLVHLKIINNSIEARNKLLVEIEVNLPMPVFSKLFSISAEKADRPLLTLGEMVVPCLFLSGYLFLGILFFFFKNEVLAAVLT